MFAGFNDDKQKINETTIARCDSDLEPSGINAWMIESSEKRH